MGSGLSFRLGLQVTSPSLVNPLRTFRRLPQLVRLRLGQLRFFVPPDATQSSGSCLRDQCTRRSGGPLSAGFHRPGCV